MKKKIGVKINIYICHSWSDYEKYKIADLAKFLEEQDEIGKVFYLEEYLTGNIDDIRRDIISKSHIMFFLATYNSAIESRDCLEELKIAIEYGVEIIPILGRDLHWEDLKPIELDRVLGFQYNENFDLFYRYIYEFLIKIRQNLIPMTKIYLSHSTRDYELFRIKEIAEFLEQHDEIYKVYYAERDLVGNIDEYMNEMILESDILIFFGSKHSINAIDCIYEINNAQKFNIELIAIKGESINWKDLTNIGFSRKTGFQFDVSNVDYLCENLYKYICEIIKERINNREFLEAEKLKKKISIKLKELLKTPKFIEFIASNKENIEKIIYRREGDDDVLYSFLTDLLEKHQKLEGNSAFFSYATEDTDFFKINKISEYLESYKDIKEAFYWEEDMRANAIKYMSDYIKNCDVFILFCSPNANESWLVEAEWSAAFQKRKPVIPVFVNEEFIPTILAPLFGVQINDIENTKEITNNIHELIQKRMKN